MNKKRVVAVFTGNRAEYGLQFPVLKAIEKHPDLEYRLIVSGAHLDNNFGKTLQEIKDDGFVVHAEAQIDLEEDNLVATSKAIGSGVLSISGILEEMQPDMFVVYADRFEGFAAVIAGTQMNIPTAHIEGGDITEGGALDDSVRHAMTKLSHIHFTTNQQATNRLLGMGEEAWRVFTVGFPAIDMIQENNFATVEEVRNKYALDIKKPIVLFTQHSVTTEFDSAVDQIQPSLEALKKLAKDGWQIIITYPNNDAGGLSIINELETFKESCGTGIQFYRSLGRYYYHGVLAMSMNRDILVVCAGNSSSGIKETPAFSCPTVNIGSRQKGRLRGENVLEAGYDSEEIYTKIIECSSNSFRGQCNNGINPYGLGDAGKKIADVLSKISLDKSIFRKGMTLKGETREGWYR